MKKEKERPRSCNLNDVEDENRPSKSLKLFPIKRGTNGYNMFCSNMLASGKMQFYFFRIYFCLN